MTTMWPIACGRCATSDDIALHECNAQPCLCARCRGGSPNNAATNDDCIEG